jgi:hypothetical protein
MMAQHYNVGPPNIFGVQKLTEWTKVTNEKSLRTNPILLFLRDHCKT